MRNISFIIITPVLGYKHQNRKYLKLEECKKNIKKIHENFTNPDIVVVTGLYNQEYVKIKNLNNNFRICENQIPFDTGETEQIRLGIDNSIHVRKVFIKEDTKIDCDKIKKGIKKRHNFIISGENNENPGMIVKNSLVYNISFGLCSDYFGDILYLNFIDSEVEEFIHKDHNKKKKMFELVNYLVGIKPMRII